MAFPNNMEIQTAAATIGEDPIVVYAYAAQHGVVPTSPNQTLDFKASVNNNAAFNIPGIDGASLSPFKYGYIQANGSPPFVGWMFTNWLVQYAYAAKGGNGDIYLTRSVPFAGEGYPPGNQATDPTTTTPGTGSTPAPSSGGVLSGLNLSGKTIAIGAGVLGVGWYLFGRRH